MSTRGKGKVRRLRRPATAAALWTDREVLALVDAVLVARDSELLDRLRNVVRSRYGVGHDNRSWLKYVTGIGPGEMEGLGMQLGRALEKLEDDPANRAQIKRLATIIGKDLALGRAKAEAATKRHQVSA